MTTTNLDEYTGVTAWAIANNYKQSTARKYAVGLGLGRRLGQFRMLSPDDCRQLKTKLDTLSTRDRGSRKKKE